MRLHPLAENWMIPELIKEQLKEIKNGKNRIFRGSAGSKEFHTAFGGGSVVNHYGLYINGVAPIAFVANNAEPIVVAGAILADIILVDQPDSDLFTIIKNGDIISIDTDEKCLRIVKKI